MDDKREVIEMLKILKEQARGIDNMTELDNVFLDSFLFVINKAIDVIEGV